MGLFRSHHHSILSVSVNLITSNSGCLLLSVIATTIRYYWLSADQLANAKAQPSICRVGGPAGSGMGEAVGEGRITTAVDPVQGTALPRNSGRRDERTAGNLKTVTNRLAAGC